MAPRFLNSLVPRAELKIFFVARNFKYNLNALEEQVQRNQAISSLGANSSYFTNIFTNFLFTFM